MKDFDRIVGTERTRDYALRDRDQFVFDTLADIQTQKSIGLKWILIAVVSILAMIVMTVQFLFFETASFTYVGGVIQEILVQKPYYLAVLNLSVIGVVLALKKARFLG